MTRAILAQVPVIVMAYDLLEHQGMDVRTWPLEKRRATLAELVETVATNYADSAPAAAVPHR